MSYAPDTPVLVAIVNNHADWQRVQEEHWYRIPVRRAPRYLDAELLAVYQSGVFGPLGRAVRWYAPIIRCQIVQRRDLLPLEAEHPRASEQYWRLELGPLSALPRPIPASRFWRVSFIPTRWQLLLAAHDVADLWPGDLALAELCQALQAEGFSVARRKLREPQPSYGPPHAPGPWIWLTPTLEGVIVRVDKLAGELLSWATIIWQPAACVAQIASLVKQVCPGWTAR